MTPPAEAQTAHGLLAASLHMTRQAATLRTNAISSTDMKLAWDASAAAAGAISLGEPWPSNSSGCCPSHPVITPRVARLVRVPDPKAMRAAIAGAFLRQLSVRRTAVTRAERGAAEELRLSLETGDAGERRALLLPDLSRRAELLPPAPCRAARAPGC